MVTHGDLPSVETHAVMKLLPFFQRDNAQRLTDAVRRGVGVQENAWPLPSNRAHGYSPLVDDIVLWVRSLMAEMRRPYGIDHVALALACRDKTGRVVCSNSLGVMKPSDFYGVEGPARIEAFLDDVRFASPGQDARIVGALLSLGDVAYELGSPQAA